jgi:hypothetical protein
MKLPGAIVQEFDEAGEAAHVGALPFLDELRKCRR